MALWWRMIPPMSSTSSLPRRSFPSASASWRPARNWARPSPSSLYRKFYLTISALHTFVLLMRDFMPSERFWATWSHSLSSNRQWGYWSTLCAASFGKCDDYTHLSWWASILTVSSLSDNSRAREALRQCLPEPLRDATFSSVLRDDAATKRCLAQLLINLSDNVSDGAPGIAM